MQSDHLWMPFTWYQDQIDFPPIVIERGEGIFVTDTAGRRYIDAVSSWWVTIFGHNNPRITAAVKTQLDKIEHILMAGFIAEPTSRLTGILGDLLPRELSRIFYSDNGSTAVEVALKIALQYHDLRASGRCEFIGLGGGYHGDTLGAMSVSSIPQYHELFHERFKKHHATDSPYCYRCPAGKNPATCSADCMESLERLLKQRHEKIAACIFEPLVQGAVGMRVYPVKVLERIFALCERYEILTIADEVATGLGKTGAMFACQHTGKTPDIMCLAKGLTGGYLPMGVTAVKEHVFNEFKGAVGSPRIFNHGHSFTGNPLAAAAACAAMQLMRELDIPKSLEATIAHLGAGLAKFDAYDIVGDIRHIGMIGALEIVKDRRTKQPFPAAARFTFRLAQRALSHGLLIRPLGNVVYVIPPYTITEEQIDTMFDMLHCTIRDAQAAA